MYPWRYLTHSFSLFVLDKLVNWLLTPTLVCLTDACPGEMLKFTGEKGQFITGHVQPALAGVRITVHDSQDRMDTVSAETTAKGDFK